jgi:hypothetical protein
MGYWVALGLIAVAVAAVLVAVLGDSEEQSRRGDDVWVVLAASDGTGHGLDAPEAMAWPALLARSMPPGAARVVNLSIGGLTLDRALTETVPEAVALRPRRAAVAEVVDHEPDGHPLDAYIADLDAALAALAATGAQVVIGNLPDLSTLPFLAEASGDAAGLYAECARWNAAIAEVAGRHGATVVDFFAEPIAPEAIGEDGFHPSDEGQRRLADRFRAALGSI